MRSINFNTKTIKFFLLIVVLVAAKCSAQIQPYVYYTFDGTTSEQWNTWTAASTGYLSPQCASLCSTTCSLIPPANAPLIVSTPQSIVGNYALFNAPNAQLKNNNIALSNNGVSFEALIRFDAAFGVQRRANLFTLSRASNQSQPGTYLNLYFNFDLTSTTGGTEIDFITDLNGGSSSDADLFTIELNGLDRRSVEYYLDGEWHHVAFSYNPNTGVKKIWVDGISPAEFTSVIAPGNFTASTCSLFVNSTVSYDKFVGGLDELAYYNDAITDEEVVQHYNDFTGSAFTGANHYTFQLTKSSSNNIAQSSDVDPNEFPFGHTVGGGDQSSDNITHTALEQLYSFPLPRFKPGNLLHKNMNLIRSKWIGDNSTSDSIIALQTSLAVQVELAAKWNYYFNLAENLSVEINQVNIPGTHPYSWMQWVTDPSNTLAASFQYAVFTNRAQIATLVKNQNFGNATNQQNFYSVRYDFAHNQYVSPYQYLNRAGNVTTTKYWLPISDVNNYTGDGVLTKSYLDHILDRLYSSTPYHISFIAENNEVAPVYDAVNAYDFTVNIPTAFKENFEMQAACPGCNQLQWLAFLGDRKIAVDDTAYRNIILNDTRLASTNFLNFGTDGGPIDRYYWPKLRQTQLYDSTGANGIFKNAYSSMDFYPITPSRWRIQVTNLTVDDKGQIPRGWRWVARARKTELSSGDKLFAPYVGAGWFLDEERNFRPGQWLGLIKCLGLTGVDFYHAYYDEINGNPKGFIWQVAMPSYSQAVLSRIDHIIMYGNVLEGDVNSTPSVPSQGKAYAFNTGNQSQLVTVRQDANEITGVPVAKFAISGTIQKLINMIGDAPLQQDVTIDLKAGIGSPDNLQFNIRRQGSTYILDRTRSNANDYAFYQLDKWHQWEYPERWSKDFDFEAEVFDNITTALAASIHTEDTNHNPITNGDYHNFTSYISGAANIYEYNFEPRAAATYYLYIRARLKNGSPVHPAIAITLTDSANATTIVDTTGCIASNEWLWYMIDNTNNAPIQYSLSTNSHKLSIQPLDDNILIDRIYLGLNPAAPDNGVAVGAAMCPGPILLQAGVTPVTCYGAPTGSITLTATGGSNSYDFSINNSAWQNDSIPFILSNLVSGTYSLQVRDHNSINDTSQVLIATVSQPPTPFVAALQVINNCNNLTTGKITAVVTGGNMNAYYYLWNTGAISGTIENLSNGTYTVTVTDAKGCTLTVDTTVITKTFTASASATSIVSTCGSGNIVININTPTDGISPYYYSTNGGTDYGNANTHTSVTFTNQQPGTLLTLVKDNEGCEAVMTGNPLSIAGSFTASVNSSITPSFILGCNGGTTNLTAAPGPAGYKYSWSTGQTTNTISNIGGGTYHVTVTQTSGGTCSARTFVTVTEPAAVNIGLTTTNVTCSGAGNGSAIAMVSGGTGTMQIVWSNGSTQNSLTGLSAGNYSVSVTDTNGCNAIKYFTITAPNTLLAAAIVQTNDASCNQLTGALNVSASNGVSPYQFLWSNNQTTSGIANLSAGTYTVTVTDAFGCPRSINTTLTEPATIYYLDADSDNYGDGNIFVTAGCTAPSGYAVLSGDCNDTNPAIHPGATEICNGIDDNCDGVADVRNITLNLKFFIEGFYRGNGKMAAVIDSVNYPTLTDTITVELHNATAPCDLVYSVRGIVDINGNVSLPLTGIICGSYYVAIRHRMSIETWSKLPVLFDNPIVSFDFIGQ